MDSFFRKCKIVLICTQGILLCGTLKAQDTSTSENDSLLYSIQRKQYNQKELTQIDSTYLSAADEMALAGLFSEAVLLLPLLKDRVINKEESDLQKQQLLQHGKYFYKPHISIQLMGEYSSNTDSSTAIFDDSLIGSPSAYDSTQFFGGFVLETVLPMLRDSSNNLTSKLEITTTMAREMLSYNTTSKNNHWALNTNAQGLLYIDKQFKDSANNIRFYCGSHYRDTLFAKGTLLLPASVTATMFKANRKGSASNQTIDFSPSFTWNFSNKFNTGFGGLLAYKNFSIPDDSLNELSFGPSISFSYSGTSSQVLANGTMVMHTQQDQTTKNESIISSLVLNGSKSLGTTSVVSFSCIYTNEHKSIFDSMLVSIDTIIRIDSNTIVNPTDTLIYTTTVRTIHDKILITGQSLEIEPEITIFLIDQFSITPGIVLQGSLYPLTKKTQTGYTLFDPEYIMETGYALTPKIAITYSNDFLDVYLTTAFKFDRPKEKETPLYEKTNSLLIDGSATWKINQSIALEVSSNYTQDTNLETISSFSFFNIATTLLVRF